MIDPLIGQMPNVPGMMHIMGAPNGNPGVVPPNLQGGPNTQFPLNPGGPVMTPGGGGTGAPLQGSPAPMPPVTPGTQGHQPFQMQPFMQAFQSYRNALMDWRQARPTHMGFDGSPQDWRTQMQDWQQGRPDFMTYLGPVMPGHMGQMQPGGGTSGAPLPGTVGMVPGVPGSMATNPQNGVIGAIPPVNPGQLPTY